MPRAFPLFGAVCIFLGLSVRGESSKDGQTPLAWDVPSLQTRSGRVDPPQICSGMQRRS
jgi:hypothetical protein